MARVVGQTEICAPYTTALHSHERHQLIYATRGVVHMATAAGEWILPPSRALWISGGTQHALMVKRSAEINILYIDPVIYPFKSFARCCVVEVTPLVRELISACALLTWNYESGTPDFRLSEVLIDRIKQLDLAPLNLSLPKDERALGVVKLLKKDPGTRKSLNELAREVGASARTIERLFSRETHLSFGAWRHRYRMLFAIERLAYGDNVTRVALEAGYESSSSFIASFRTMFGTTPSRYFRFEPTASNQP
ncbi:helix-turn-helix transcriptional regulator [Salmonella enterica]|nr:helix-turn-helix transcriptional regulator [Salmonella enterica]EHK1850871.1 helix-turn-helix transcriptional regulator [Salmonella enterica]EHK1997109.1 helix-turn-helix transcriptional regulator [Salmonella enterica]EHN5165010.1 helix-turn-helix transcriptional regulator [Salmonella enterica]